MCQFYNSEKIIASIRKKQESEEFWSVHSFYFLTTTSNIKYNIAINNILISDKYKNFYLQS